MDFTTRIAEGRIGHPDLGDDEGNTCIMFAVPPGLLVGVGCDYSSFPYIRPQSDDRVRVKQGLIFFGDHWSQQDVDNAIALLPHTMDEDRQVLLRVQQGLGSRFHEPGPLAARDLKGTIWDFHQYLSRSLVTAKKSARN